jgi:predicted DNA-binding transcriptional regulator YafY
MSVREGGRLSQLEKSARLVSALLAGRELSRADVSRLLGVGLAAADRHLGAVQLHFPVIRTRYRGRTLVRLDRSKLLASRKSPPLGTVIAACLGGSLARLFEGTTYQAGMMAVVRHLVDETRGAETFQQARRQFFFVGRGGERALPESAGILDDLLEAILHGRFVRIRYVGFEGEARYETVQPLSFAVYEHQLYLLGGNAAGRVKPYRFARVRSVRLLPKRFEYPDKDTYEPEALFADSFGVFVDPKYPVERVEISLHPRWAHYVKTHRWHRSQHTWVDRGRTHLELRVRVCPEVVAWVLSFGPDAQVVSPPAFRATIAGLAEQLAEQYAEPRVR